jgi:hypothetical protein
MWTALASFVQSGGSVMLSYGGGDADPAVRELFGVEFLGDHGGRPVVSCRIAQPGLVGDLTSFDVRLDLPHYALLGASGATVVATDATGSPLLTVHQYGQGRAIFVAAPLERAIAQSDPWAAPDAVRSMLRTVYGSVATATLTAERVVALVTDVRGGAAAEVGSKAFAVPLAPNGAVALRLTYA